MDINLNVPINNASDFLGNNSVTYLQTEKEGGFKDIFDDFKDRDESSEDIDSSLLISLLNSFQIENIEDDMKDMDGQVVGLNNTDNINNFYRDEGITVINSTAINSLDINDSIMNITENEGVKDLNNKEYELVKKIEKSNIFSDTNDISYENKIETNFNRYDDLETSFLNNRNNMVKPLYINKDDKDMSTLESILNYEDMNEIMETEAAKTEIMEPNTIEVKEERNKLEYRSNNDNFIFTNNTNLNSELSSIDYKDNNEISHIREEFISEDIVKTVKYLKVNGTEEITIKISPRELGDMTIKLIKNEEDTTVDITINKEDVFNLVSDNISEIIKHLEDLNISVKDVSVNIKNNNQNYLSHNFNQEFDRKNQQSHENLNKKQILNNKEDNNEGDNTEGENNLNILV